LIIEDTSNKKGLIGYNIGSRFWCTSTGIEMKSRHGSTKKRVYSSWFKENISTNRCKTNV